MIKYINKKLLYSTQRSLVINFVYLGTPIGYIVSQIMFIIKDTWEVYEFSLFTIIFHFVFCISISLPIIIAYFKNKKKKKKIWKMVMDDNKNVTIKFTNEHFNAKIGDIFTLKSDNFSSNFIYVVVKSDIYFLNEIISKIEIDDLAMNRKRKLKKLNRKSWFLRSMKN